MNGIAFKEKLKKFRKFKIIFTNHAKSRCKSRKINEFEVINDLRNPAALKLVQKLSENKGCEKYKLWFVFNTYIVVFDYINARIIVRTVFENFLFKVRR